MTIRSAYSTKASQAILGDLPTLSSSVFPEESAFGMLYGGGSTKNKDHEKENIKETDSILRATQREDRLLGTVPIPDLERDGSRSKYTLGIHERESSFVFVEYRQDRRNAGLRTKTKNTVRINQGEEVRSWQA